MEKNWKVLKTEEEYDIALERIIEIFHAENDTPEDDELSILLPLVKDYEDRNFSIPDPIILNRSKKSSNNSAFSK